MCRHKRIYPMMLCRRHIRVLLCLSTSTRLSMHGGRYNLRCQSVLIRRVLELSSWNRVAIVIFLTALATCLRQHVRRQRGCALSIELGLPPFRKPSSISAMEVTQLGAPVKRFWGLFSDSAEFALPAFPYVSLRRGMQSTQSKDKDGQS